MACIGSSAATSTRKSHSSSTESTSRRIRPRSSCLQVAHRGGRQTPGHEAPDAGVTGVVHHVQHDAGHREVLNDRAPVGSVAARLRGIGHGVVQHLEHLVIGGHRPEALPVGRVDGGLVPPHRRLLPVQAEDVVREAAGERVEVGQVDLAEVMHHGAILTAVSTRSRMVAGGRSPTGRGRALKPSPVRVRIPPPPPHRPGLGVRQGPASVWWITEGNHRWLVPISLRRANFAQVVTFALGEARPHADTNEWP